jgi:hypothetical protein
VGNQVLAVSALWVMPSIDPVWRDVCLDTMSRSVIADLIVVDNTQLNLGVAASWNIGRRLALELGRDWLVIVSESMRFGKPGGMDFIDQLHGAPWIDSTFGWHLIAFSTELVERVGAFDEMFWPAYGEDSDYLIRMALAGYPSPRVNDLPHARRCVPVDATHTGFEHSLRRRLVAVDLAANHRYFDTKWGGTHPDAAWEHPFNRPELDWTYAPARVQYR